MESANI